MTRARRDTRSGATEILVRPGHEGRDPAGDGLQRFQVAFRELPCPAAVPEIPEEEQISSRCWHGTIS